MLIENNVKETKDDDDDDNVQELENEQDETSNKKDTKLNDNEKQKAGLF